MKILSNLRFLAYIIVLLVFYFSRHKIIAIPAHLSGEDKEDWYERMQQTEKTRALERTLELQRENERIPLNKLFENTSLSGSQVIEIARSVATKDGADLSEASQQSITLQKKR